MGSGKKQLVWLVMKIVFISSLLIFFSLYEIGDRRLNRWSIAKVCLGFHPSIPFQVSLPMLFARPPNCK